MKNIFASAFILLLCGQVFGMGETPQKTMDLSKKIKPAKTCDSLKFTCHIFSDKVLLIRSCENDAPPLLDVGYVSGVDKDHEGMCMKANEKLVLKDIENGSYVGAHRNFVFVEDEMAAPSSGGFHVYDLTDGKSKLSIGTSGEPVTFKNNKIVYFKSKEIVFKPNNPKRWKELGCDDSWAEGYLGCNSIVETEVDLTTFKETETKKFRVISNQ